MTIERILGTDTGKEAFGKTDRNFIALETAVDENKTQINTLDDKIGTLETQTILENYLSAHSIPSTTKRGKLDVKLKGMSAVNLVKNGNFANGTTGWIGENATLSTSENVMSVTANGASSAPIYVKNDSFNVIAGHKYYLTSTVRVTNSNCTMMYAYARDGNNAEISPLTFFLVTSPEINKWYKLSGVGMMLNGGLGDIRGYHQYTDATTANNKVMQVKNILLVDLTALFGAGNEPTKEQCDLMFANYFDGLQGASNIKVKATGKNLFNKSTASYGYYLGSDAKPNLHANSFQSDYIEVEPSTQYSFTHGNAQIVEYDAQYNNLGRTFNTTAVYIHTTLPNARYIRISFYNQGWGIADNVQLEKGATVASYESYKGTEVTYKTLDGQPITLHRLTNGVYDEITDDGKLIKRIGEKTLIAGDIIANIGDLQGYSWFSIAKSSDDYLNGNFDSTITNSNRMLIDGGTPIGIRTSATSANQYVNYAGTTYGYSFVLGTTTEQARTALVGKKLIYELAQPQILDTNATPLVAEPNGSVFITPTASPQPKVELSYPVNIGAVIDGLLEGQKQQSELLNEKVNTKQPNWITATLQNGWTGTLHYRKNSLGQLEIAGVINAGTVSWGTIIATLPAEYKPKTWTSMPMFITDGNGIMGISMATDGAIKIYSPASGTVVAGKQLVFSIVLPI